MIKLNAVSKKYESTVALHPLSTTFTPQKTTFLIGPSGCGKSTLLRLIMGLIAPTSGQVELTAGTPNRNQGDDPRQRMGFSIQGGGLFPHLTAKKNILLMPEHLGQDATRIKKRLEELCELTHFPKEALSRFPIELSGGQQQRVSLMRALFLDPDVLLLDEPLGALDPLVRSSLQKELKAIFQQLHKTVIFVSHDMAEAGYLGDEIMLLKEGHLIQKGTLDDLRKTPSDPFVTEFITAQRSLVEL